MPGWWRVPRDAIGLSYADLARQSVRRLPTDRLAGLNRKIIRVEVHRCKEILLASRPPPGVAELIAGLGCDGDDLGAVRRASLRATLSQEAVIDLAAAVVEIATELALVYCRAGVLALDQVCATHGLRNVGRRKLKDRAARAARESARRLLLGGHGAGLVAGRSDCIDRIRDDAVSAIEPVAKIIAGAAHGLAVEPSAAPVQPTAQLWNAVAVTALDNPRRLFPLPDQAEDLLGQVVVEVARRLAARGVDPLDEDVIRRELAMVARSRILDWWGKELAEEGRRSGGGLDPERPTRDPFASVNPEDVVVNPPPEAMDLIEGIDELLRALDEWEADRGADLVGRIGPARVDTGRRAAADGWRSWLRRRWDEDSGTRPRPPKARSRTFEEAPPRVHGLILAALRAFALGEESMRAGEGRDGDG